MRVVVVGAGMAGLTAARRLTTAGHDVTVLDKGRSPGGRMATRRIAGARVDHGAQFFTVRGHEFAAQVDEWARDGLATVWCHGFDGDDGHPRWAAPAGMTSLAKGLAVGVDVQCDRLVFSIRDGADEWWEVVVDDGSVLPADAVVVTCPLPQTFSLLVEAGVDLPMDLVRTDYDRTQALLAVLDRPSVVPTPGGLIGSSLDGSPFSFVGDNQAKGLSGVPAVTFHAGAGWSEEHWGDDPAESIRLLLDAARPWLGDAVVVESQLKRWRFATPRQLWPEPCWVSSSGSLALAGDAFAGPRGTGSNLEGAFTSGLAAADALLAHHP